MMGQCIVGIEAGARCNCPAAILNLHRGGLVCDIHVPGGSAGLIALTCLGRSHPEVPMMYTSLGGDSGDDMSPAVESTVDPGMLTLQQAIDRQRALLTKVRATLPAMPPEHASQVQSCLAKMELLLTRLELLAWTSSLNE
jgi:hypothetical protein